MNMRFVNEDLKEDLAVVTRPDHLVPPVPRVGDMVYLKHRHYIVERVVFSYQDNDDESNVFLTTITVNVGTHE
jgi:hypothetical protein